MQSLYNSGKKRFLLTFVVMVHIETWCVLQIDLCYDQPIQSDTFRPRCPETDLSLWNSWNSWTTSFSCSRNIWDFCWHYKDADFGNDFFTLRSTTDITDKDTIKVVYIQEPPTVTLILTDIDSSFSSNSDGTVLSHYLFLQDWWAKA